MKRLGIIIAIVVLSFSAYCQDSPFVGHIIVRTYPTSHVNDADTITIGCNDAGGWGYQKGLDSIDTVYTKPLNIFAFDSTISANNQYCFNLKKDIKNFARIDTYTIVIHYDSFYKYQCYLTLDTTSFNYKTSKFTIGLVEYIAGNGAFGNYFGPTNIEPMSYSNNKWYYENNNIIFISPSFAVFNCPANSFTMKVLVYFFRTVGIEPIRDNLPTIFLQNYPDNENPVIHSSIPFTGNATLFDVEGRKIITEEITTQEIFSFNTAALKSGLYIIQLQNTENQFTYFKYLKM